MAPVKSDKKPKLKAPPGACDCHMHVYDSRFPAAPNAKLHSDGALATDYLKMRERLGLSRTVVQQPSAYGKDNSCMLDAMATIGPSARGVVCVDETTSDEEFDRLTRLGVRGVRFFMLPATPALPWSIMETMAARIAPFGWHINVQLDGRKLPEHDAMLSRLPGRLVIDHTGKFLEPVAPDHPAFRVLLRLVEAGRTWVKLSGPYETSKLGAPYYDDVGRLAKTLVKAAPERMVWGTNWPHVSPGVIVPDDADVLDVLLDWVPGEANRKKVLVDNPADLYGY
jgi:D-galactarolactone isomerase